MSKNKIKISLDCPFKGTANKSKHETFDTVHLIWRIQVNHITINTRHCIVLCMRSCFSFNCNPCNLELVEQVYANCSPVLLLLVPQLLSGRNNWILTVRDHVGRWAKNKRMFWFPDMWFIFNLHTRNIFLLYRIHMYYISNIQGMHELIVWKETPYLECWLFVHGSNPHPCWSLAQSQLPHLRPPPPCCPPFHCTLPANINFIYIQMTLASLILLLSGTLSNTEHEIWKLHQQSATDYPQQAELNLEACEQSCSWS
jgi:hypothetical protein